MTKEEFMETSLAIFEALPDEKKLIALERLREILDHHKKIA